MSQENNIEFSQEERDKVANFWNSEKKAGRTPSLSQIVEFFTGGEITDPRTTEGKRVRAIISALEVQPVKTEWVKKEGVTNIELNDDQKLFIRNNCESNKTYELAKTLFPPPQGQKLQPLGKEVRAINKYLEEIGHSVKKVDEPRMAEGRYEPPKNFHPMMAKINQYLHTELSTQNATAYEKKCIETTIQFLHSPRFIQEINNYNTVEKRIAFESEFIRAVYNKPDLSPEEVSLSINWCSDILQAADLKKQLEKLNEILDNVEEDSNGKISMSLVEAIGKVTTNLNEVLKRQERIYSILNTARSKRTEDKRNRQANLSELYEWFRTEENRRKALRQVELQKEARKNEIERIESLDDTIMLSLGLTTQEALL